jgi:LAGLIDADG DNA endonuclease family
VLASTLPYGRQEAGKKDILIGTILGDSSLEKRGRSQNARLRFDQTFPEHTTYLMHIYSHFINLAGKGPKVYIRKPDKLRSTNKIYSSMQFKILALPCLNYYYDLFYKEGKKIIPSNISDLLTARAFAYWISDEGV